MPGQNLTNEKRTELLWFLQESAKPENKNGLKRGTIESAAARFQCSVKTVQRIWTRGRQANGVADSKKKGRSGRKRLDRTGKLHALKQVKI